MTYNTALADRLGISRMQRTHWARNGWLHEDGLARNPGHGNRFVLTEREIEHALIMARMVRELSMMPATASKIAWGLLNHGTMSYGGFEIRSLIDGGVSVR